MLLSGLESFSGSPNIDLQGRMHPLSLVLLCDLGCASLNLSLTVLHPDPRVSSLGELLPAQSAHAAFYFVFVQVVFLPRCFPIRSV